MLYRSSLLAKRTKAKAIKPYREKTKKEAELNLGINSGHDLNFQNVIYFVAPVLNILELLIGQAIICECLYCCLENTIKMYKKK